MTNSKKIKKGLFKVFSPEEFIPLMIKEIKKMPKMNKKVLKRGLIIDETNEPKTKTL